MKKILTYISCAILLASACTDDNFGYGSRENGNGTLSFDSFALLWTEDVNVVTKATETADDTYMLFIYDKDGSKVWEKSYGALKADPSSLSLLAGDYSLVVRSTASEVPNAKFDSPVYGAGTDFSIVAGQTTQLGSVTCSLLQCAVSVRYNDGFLSMVTGDGSTSVEVSSGYPLDYALSYNSGSPTYEMRTGYFALNNGENTSMTVTFKGLVEGKNQKMTAAVSGVKAKDWHIITFLKKVDASGNASFAIEIDGLVTDAELDNDVSGVEEGDGNDPQAPAGDGGIELVSTCDYDITQPITVPAEGTAFNLTMQAIIPDGARKFTVDIASTNEDFIGSVNTVGGTTLDLINPSEASLGVFDIVPFPHGSELSGATSINFDLSAAQVPLLAFKGTHTFTMNVTDNNGCRKSIDIVLVVE